MGAGAVSDFAACFGGPCSSCWIASSSLNRRRGAWSRCNLKYHSVLISMGGPPISGGGGVDGRGKRGSGRGEELGGEGGGEILVEMGHKRKKKKDCCLPIS